MLSPTERPDLGACQRNQADWFGAHSAACGGAIWTEGSLSFVAPGPAGDTMLLFPDSIPADALEAGVDRAWAHGSTSIGAWLRPDVDVAALRAAGFERGWQPWWMAGRLADIEPSTDDRVTLETETPEYDGIGEAMLAMTRVEPTQAWHAVARVDGRLAGRAWAHFDGETIGIYDMEVWPAYRRRGLASALLARVCEAAAGSGAEWAVLNATPAGEPVYRRYGFVRIGDGITWWLHRT